MSGRSRYVTARIPGKSPCVSHYGSAKECKDLGCIYRKQSSTARGPRRASCAGRPGTRRGRLTFEEAQRLADLDAAGQTQFLTAKGLEPPVYLYRREGEGKQYKTTRKSFSPQEYDAWEAYGGAMAASRGAYNKRKTQAGAQSPGAPAARKRRSKSPSPARQPLSPAPAWTPQEPEGGLPRSPAPSFAAFSPVSAPLPSRQELAPVEEEEEEVEEEEEEVPVPPPARKRARKPAPKAAPSPAPLRRSERKTASAYRR